jgi:hypothetical protein
MRRNQFIGKGLSAIALLLISQLCTAGGETTKSPILDRVEVMHTAPENLEELSLEELRVEKVVRERDLSVIKEASDDPDVAKQKLLEVILEHDDKRLKIVEVIPQLIDTYQIKGEFRDALLGYNKTFDVDVRNARKDVHKLDDYKSYDFRFSAVYMSMMFKFNENPEFHKKMVADLQNPNSVIGKYRRELDESYAKVEHDKYLMQNVYSVDELERAIAIIDEEISKRKHAEL